MKNLNEQLELIRRGTVEIIQEAELRKKIEKSIKTKKPLLIKAGFDPTAPDIHLGHTVLLRKLRHFQLCGHKVLFLIGDATALVGDPSGRSVIRKMLTPGEVEQNAITYEKQVGKILDINNKQLFERKKNSEWFCKKKTSSGKETAPFTFHEFVDLAQKYTVARLLERDDFEKRIKDNKPISFLELFYPLMQGYDSVKLNADVELGGTDQKFNMLVGRNLQHAYGNEDAQVVITMPLLEGVDGVDKMSKSLGNYIGINEAPKEIFGKVMSISDELMLKYYELLTEVAMDHLKKEIASCRLHPKKAKADLAAAIVKDYYGEEMSNKASQEFEKVFSEGLLPDRIPQISVTEEKYDILTLIKKTDLVSSSGEAKRLIAQGAVYVDGKKIAGVQTEVHIGAEGIIIKIGKRRFAKVLRQ